MKIKNYLLLVIHRSIVRQPVVLDSMLFLLFINMGPNYIQINYIHQKFAMACSDIPTHNFIKIKQIRKRRITPCLIFSMIK